MMFSTGVLVMFWILVTNVLESVLTLYILMRNRKRVLDDEDIPLYSTGSNAQ